jgi:thiol:disulfide interchange protein DsbC
MIKTFLIVTGLLLSFQSSAQPVVTSAGNSELSLNTEKLSIQENRHKEVNRSTALSSDIFNELMGKLKLQFGKETPISKLTSAPVDNGYFVNIGGKQVVYFPNSNQVIVGDMFSTLKQENTSDNFASFYNKGHISLFNKENLITFKSDNEITEMFVFTDADCGYCQKLHSEVKDYNNLGITIHYLPGPRGGRTGPGYLDTLKIWCADDQYEAMDIAKEVNRDPMSKVDFQSIVPNRECIDIVDEGIQTAQYTGVRGTPAIYLKNGIKIGGYLPAKRALEIYKNVYQN